MNIPTNVVLSWNCDYCGKSALTISQAGTVYCSLCRKTNGTNIYDINKKNKDRIGDEK